MERAAALALAVLAGGLAPPRVDAQQAAAVGAPSESRTRPSRPRNGGLFVYAGRAMQGFAGGPRGSAAYATALNAVHAALGQRTTIYSVIVPTAQEFYFLNPNQRGRRRERPNIMGTYGLLNSAIRTVDAQAEIAQHTAENIYFRTDHHWTGLAAYYAYRAFCAAAGLTPVPLARLQRRVVNPAWTGSLRRLAPDARLVPDEVEILVPPATAELRSVPRTGLARVVPLFRERSTGYGVFLGGDSPIVRGRTSTRNGRRVILVKNSYGNAFAPHLVSHYEEVVFLDYRSYRGSLARLVAESEMPTDLIFMNGALTSNSTGHCRMLQQLLHGRR
jgi:hypothetical protein